MVYVLSLPTTFALYQEKKGGWSVRRGFLDGRGEVFSNDFLSCFEEACWRFGGLMGGREAAGVGEPCPGQHPLRVLKLGEWGWDGQPLPSPTDVSPYFFSPSPTETLNHISAFPAIYMGMIHSRVVSRLQPKPTNLRRMLPCYFLPALSLGASELGISTL